MKNRRHTPEQVIRKLAEADKLLAQGKTIEAHSASTPCLKPRSELELGPELCDLGLEI